MFFLDEAPSVLHRRHHFITSGSNGRRQSWSVYMYITKLYVHTYMHAHSYYTHIHMHITYISAHNFYGRS